MNQQELLDEYKKFDYLNKENSLVKIFVSYIKPEFLFKSDILTPIHLGRAVEKESSKSGEITQNDTKWLHQNCIGDDDFEGNISHLNRRIGFLTGTMKAYRNYEKLGNPKYFGSFGYRKLLDSSCLANLEDYDFILPELYTTKATVKKFLTWLHGSWLYAAMEEVMARLHPDELDDMRLYFNQHSAYSHEIYIFKKELFFNYCAWIFEFLDELLKIDFTKYPILKEDKDNYKLYYFESIGEKRDIAYIIERITGYYLYRLKNTTKLKCKEVPVVTFMREKTQKERWMDEINQMRFKIKKGLVYGKNISNSTHI